MELDNNDEIDMLWELSEEDEQKMQSDDKTELLDLKPDNEKIEELDEDEGNMDMELINISELDRLEELVRKDNMELVDNSELDRLDELEDLEDEDKNKSELIEKSELG